MYRYILFDLDGTLTDSKEGILRSLHYAFAQMGDPVPDEETLLQFIGPPLQDSFTHLCGYGPEKTRQAIRAFQARYNSVGKFENIAAPGLLELCGELRERGVTLALASSKPEEMCLAICRHFGYASVLTAMTGSPPQGDWDKKCVILEALRRLQIPEEERGQVLMVGDRRFDVEGAAACGIDCVGVEFFGYAEPDELKNAGAVAVVQTVDALREFLLSHSTQNP